MLLWSSYLLADWSANFAVGLISKNQGKDPKTEDPPQDKKLMALWAPFLLLHLGGPDTITAFALEDNALWLRHVFGLVFQAIAGIYVVLQSLPNSLWVIILLVFISGTIKYLERTIALYSASLDNFRDSMIQAADPGPNYAKLMEEYKAKKEARLPTKIILFGEPSDKEHRPKKLVHPSKALSGERKELTHLEIVQYAYKFFGTFKGLVVNLIFSFKERDESLEIFDNLNDPEEALRIIEVELGFLYDSFFTKTAVLHTIIGTLSRIVASGTLVAAFILFHMKPNKGREFHRADVVVTYTLFAVGITLDFISILLFMFSDWTCASLSSLKDDPEEALSSMKDRFFNWLLSLRKLHWKKLELYKEGEPECPKDDKQACLKKGEHKCPMHIQDSRNLKVACKTILKVRSDIDPMDVKGDQSKSVLFDASRLAKDLMEMETKNGKNKWEILSKVWVELLCYAACHCDTKAHVEQLSRGAELINFVWLLMAHFGLTDQFQINKGDARAKLIIGK
ncbi:hypothetical protein AALP_AA5G059100 [Arabis alpina]|uniref:DUF4220 domain-containing protein n=1 Tax=Arabis alpina TaxID=50452 RepID=A0A087GV78_ARAAL|nr:hypothetical protein AALP_AA5G059100 [Arabis alpina]